MFTQKCRGAVSFRLCPPCPSRKIYALPRTTDEGESVFVDGVKDPALRSQLAAFLTALGLAQSPEKGAKGGAPLGFQCIGGGVLRGVASLMDEQKLAARPPLDREAAFNAAKEASRGDGRDTECLWGQSAPTNSGSLAASPTGQRILRMMVEIVYRNCI